MTKPPENADSGHDEKNDVITAIPELLSMISLKGGIVIIDAMEKVQDASPTIFRNPNGHS
ncbi:MAG TPA: hypothetical protein DIC34_09120 [Treponema sp.]|nr:MAG: hypothetical protein A2Y36_05000 [Treponema sp. GWA1_62_8]OHE64474.1 MAG: hypothetical protein A2001_02325 [Treponema sp. GWC1_61_84]OHE75505.1 MAG: hypothetical protein A2413_13780 [Treponema sp. RIFOXYC1_FULL_61_9]HCM26688.1 hypothetical protein [Treponema sp.]